MLLAFAEELGLLNTLPAADATRLEVTSPRDLAIVLFTPFHECRPSY